MVNFNDFSALAWNVRGFASCKSRRHMHEILGQFKPGLIVLSETHTRFENSTRRDTLQLRL